MLGSELNKKVLLIEDRADVLENLKEYLELEGYAVETATNGEEGIDKAHSTLPDVIICDVMMPGMNGYKVLERLLASPVTQHIPFIFSTSLSERIEKSAALDLGADDYFIKPFEPDALLVAVNRLAKEGSKRKKHINI